MCFTLRHRSAMTCGNCSRQRPKRAMENFLVGSPTHIQDYQLLTAGESEVAYEEYPRLSIILTSRSNDRGLAIAGDEAIRGPKRECGRLTSKDASRSTSSPDSFEYGSLSEPHALLGLKLLSAGKHMPLSPNQGALCPESFVGGEQDVIPLSLLECRAKPQFNMQYCRRSL